MHPLIDWVAFIVAVIYELLVYFQILTVGVFYSNKNVMIFSLEMAPKTLRLVSFFAVFAITFVVTHSFLRTDARIRDSIFFLVEMLFIYLMGRTIICLNNDTVAKEKFDNYYEIGSLFNKTAMLLIIAIIFTIFFGSRIISFFLDMIC
jgi:hypothetical protein